MIELLIKELGYIPPDILMSYFQQENDLSVSFINGKFWGIDGFEEIRL